VEVCTSPRQSSIINWKDVKAVYRGVECEVTTLSVFYSHNTLLHIERPKQIVTTDSFHVNLIAYPNSWHGLCRWWGTSTRHYSEPDSGVTCHSKTSQNTTKASNIQQDQSLHGVSSTHSHVETFDPLHSTTYKSDNTQSYGYGSVASVSKSTLSFFQAGLRFHMKALRTSR